MRTTGASASLSRRAASSGAQAPDCAQGAFHDYWISLRGADGTVRRAHGVSPRFLCNGHLWYVRPCWFRYFVEQAIGPIVDSARSIRTACAGLHRLQRYGCVSAAALSIPEDPLTQTRICARLAARDAGACLRGVAVQALQRSKPRQRALFALCTHMPRGARSDCERWFGRTLALVTNGRFRCPDTACRQGASIIGEAASDFLVVRVYPQLQVSATKGGAAHMTVLAGTSVRS